MSCNDFVTGHQVGLLGSVDLCKGPNKVSFVLHHVKVYQKKKSRDEHPIRRLCLCLSPDFSRGDKMCSDCPRCL